MVVKLFGGRVRCLGRLFICSGLVVAFASFLSILVGGGGLGEGGSADEK